MRFCLVFVLLLQLSSVFSQSDKPLFSQYKFQVLNEEMGLNNNFITDVAQDTLGYIWVATERGLYRYQGDHFQTYLKEEENANSIPSNYISDIAVDQQNRLWIMTEAGVAQYDYAQDAVTRLEAEPLKKASTSIVIDTNEDKYIGRYDGGIIHISDTIIELPLKDVVSGRDFSNASVVDLALSDHTLWAALDGDGILSFNLETSTLQYYSPFKLSGYRSLDIYELYIDHFGVLWFGCDRGLFRLDPKNANQPMMEPKLDVQLSRDDYLSIYEDEEHIVWIGTRQGGMYSLNNQDVKKPTILKHFVPTNSDAGPSHRTISKIFKDEKGLLWLGTHNGGVNVFDPNGENIRFLTEDPLHKNALSYKNIWGLEMTSDGEIWVGTDGKGLNILNPKTGTIDNVSWPEIENTAILTILEDASKNLWLGTYENGIFQIDLKTNQVYNFKVGDAAAQLKVNDVRCIIQGPGHEIYFGTNRGGAYYYNEQSSQVELFVGTEGYDIRSIYPSSFEQEILWMATYRNGLIRYNSKTFETFNYPLTDKKDNTSITILDICIKNNVLFLGTREKGLVSFNLMSKEYSFDYPGEIVNIAISALTFDKDNNLWMTTSEGVFAYNNSDQEVSFSDRYDGFKKGHFNYGSILYSEAGYMVVGGIYGMNLFYPEQLLSDPVAEQVLFNEFKILNKKVTPSNSDVYPKDQSIFLTKEINLNYAQNEFGISWAIPRYNNFNRNQFTYRLHGYDDNWFSSDGNNFAEYRNVDAGNYVFEIRNSSNEKFSKKLNITITPPVWRTWQAYLLFFILGVLLLWRALRFNNSRIVLKQKLKFEQDLREKEHLSMTEKLRFYTNFSHELKTPLTLIQGPVNDLLKKERDPTSRQYLEIIRKNSGILLKFINRMLEFRKIELDRTLLNVGHYDLNILAEEEVEAFAHLAKERNINLGFYCEQGLNAWVDIEKIQIILNNLLSNALKFSPEDRTVKLGLFHDNDEIVIEVRDQGHGISKSDMALIFTPFYQAKNSVGTGGTGIGLALCKSLVELHQGSIAVESSRNGETVFTIRLLKGKTHLKNLEYVRFLDNEEDLSPNRYYSVEAEEDESTEQNAIEESEQLILVVDDNKDIAAYISTIVGTTAKVVIHHNGADAIEDAIKLIPDLIITDLMMPGIDGINFCQTVKNHFATSHIPVIMVTAKSSDSSVIEGYNVGADDYITKPFNSEILKTRIDNLLSNRKLLALKYSSSDLLDSKEINESKEAEFILKLESNILELIDNEEIDVPILCESIGMSQASLYRKVKSLTGESIQIFIRKIKLKRAANLLLQDHLSISEIAFSLNFASLKYFRKCFKTQYDKTPSDYKRSHARSLELKS